MKARIPLPQREQLSAAGRSAYDSVLSTRHNLDGPFLAWLHSPELASPAEKLGAFCRYRTIFSVLESELLILITAAHFRCTGEWQIHAPIALDAGLDLILIDALLTGLPPQFNSARLTVLHGFSTEVLRNGTVSTATFAQARELFGCQGMVELVGILGYYGFVAMTLNAFEMKFDDRTDPFAPQIHK